MKGQSKRGGILLKRAYDPPAASDGRRVLVDRLWPRGVSKDQAQIDEWLKEIAPSDALRKWFGHKPERWEEFRKRYKAELRDKGDLLKQLEEAAAQGMVTLVYAARDAEHNQAVVLQEELQGRKGSRRAA